MNKQKETHNHKRVCDFSKYSNSLQYITNVFYIYIYNKNSNMEKCISDDMNIQ